MVQKIIRDENLLTSSSKESRSIVNIIEELKSHPDYVCSSVWTKELCVDEIELWIDNEYALDEKEEKYLMAEKIFEINKENFKKIINECYDRGFDDYCLLEDASFPKEYLDKQNG